MAYRIAGLMPENLICLMIINHINLLNFRANIIDWLILLGGCLYKF